MLDLNFIVYGRIDGKFEIVAKCFTEHAAQVLAPFYFGGYITDREGNLIPRTN